VFAKDSRIARGILAVSAAAVDFAGIFTINRKHLLEQAPIIPVAKFNHTNCSETETQRLHLSKPFER
jgi:hypothetical protein